MDIRKKPPSELQKEIIRRLREFRLKADLRVEDLAAEIDCSRSGVVKMEDEAIGNPALRSLEDYVRACGRTLEDLFSGTSKRNGKRRVS